MGVLFNFGEIDLDATVIKTREFFKKDVPKLEQLAGLAIQQALVSPKLDDSKGTGASAINHTEIMVIKSVDAKREIRLVAKAIRRCSDRSRKLIIGQYSQRLRGWQLEQRLGLSRTVVAQYKRQALLEFANCYAGCGRDIRVRKNNDDKN